MAIPWRPAKMFVSQDTHLVGTMATFGKGFSQNQYLPPWRPPKLCVFTHVIFDTMATTEIVGFAHNQCLTPRRHPKIYVSHIINCWHHGDVSYTIIFRHHGGLPEYMFLIKSVFDAMATSEKECFSHKQLLTSRRAPKMYVSHTINFSYHACHDLGCFVNPTGLKGPKILFFAMGSNGPVYVRKERWPAGSWQIPTISWQMFNIN